MSSNYDCTQCNGDGFYSSHAPECHTAQDCVSEQCPVQVQCRRCKGRGWEPPVVSNPSGEEPF
jgi:hypothetical protein